jgi:hypothetical protein
MAAEDRVDPRPQGRIVPPRRSSGLPDRTGPDSIRTRRCLTCPRHHAPSSA